MNKSTAIRACITVVLLQWSALGEGGAARFASLHRLVGDWEATTNSGSTVRVSYRLIAADSALVETFTTASGRETLTIYHPDGPNLIATHYCAQRNQPRLRLTPGSTDAVLQFEFYDATNLSDPGASHLKVLRLEMLDGNHFNKTEIYTEHGKDEATDFHFVRLIRR